MVSPRLQQYLSSKRNEGKRTLNAMECQRLFNLWSCVLNAKRRGVRSTTKVVHHRQLKQQNEQSKPNLSSGHLKPKLNSETFSASTLTPSSIRSGSTAGRSTSTSHRSTRTCSSTVCTGMAWTDRSRSFELPQRSGIARSFKNGRQIEFKMRGSLKLEFV